MLQSSCNIPGILAPASQGGPASLLSDWPGCVSNKMTHHAAAKTAVVASDDVLTVVTRNPVQVVRRWRSILLLAQPSQL